MSKALAVFMLIFFCCIPAGAQVVENGLPPVLELFEEPARELGISKPLALAIAGVESGLSPWVLNIEGQPFRFDSKEEALEKAGQAWAAGQSFDLGLMQVNSQWLRRFGISPEAALDPLANIYFGGWILKQEIDRHGDLRAAIGAYHSPTPARASRYADQVMAALKKGPVVSPGRRKSITPVDNNGEPAKAAQGQKMIGTGANRESSMTVLSRDKVIAGGESFTTTPNQPEKPSGMLIKRFEGK